MKTCLLTGSAGFVGKHFLAKLKDLGYDVNCLDIKTGSDCRDFFKTNNTQFDLVVHCAANVGGRANMNSNPMNIYENLSIDQSCLDWVVRTNPAKVVLFSSSAAYPIELQTSKATLLTESDIDLYNPREPDAAYGWCKINLEKLAQTARRFTTSQIYVFRPFSGHCGVTQDLSYPFPSFIKRALDPNQRPFEIWGDPYSCRDWIHIDDIVSAVFTVINSNYPSVEALNLCTGISTSFQNLAILCCEAAGMPLKNELWTSTPKDLATVKNPASILVNNNAPSGVHTRVGDASKLRELYFPKITVRESIERAIKHFKDQMV